MALLRLSHAQPSYQPQATVMRMSSSELAAGADLDDSNHQVGLPSSPLLNSFYIY